MPTYEYVCMQCGHTFEVLQNMSDKELSKCPKCAKKLRRVIGGGAGLIFKGSGFYATDYKKKSHAELPKPDSKGCPNAKGACNGCPHA